MTGITLADSIYMVLEQRKRRLKDCIFLIVPCLTYTTWKISNDVAMKRITAWKAAYIFSRVYSRHGIDVAFVKCVCE